MNYMKDVAKLLGVEIGEEFKINKEYNHNNYILTENGLMFKRGNDLFRSEIPLESILLGDYQITKSILTDKEKEDLSGVIRPWRDRVQYIKKTDCDTWDGIREYITIKYKEYYDTSRPCFIDLPTFETGTMYKGMELEKEYSLEDLKL